MQTSEQQQSISRAAYISSRAADALTAERSDAAEQSSRAEQSSEIMTAEQPCSSDEYHRLIVTLLLWH
jgi:hypothetical protein